MNRRILVGIGSLLICSASFAQTFGGIYEKNIGDNMKVSYPYLGESDVVWAKSVYRIIDLREKMNLSLFYPSVKFDTITKQFVSEMADGRMSFSGLLLNEILKGKVMATDGNEMTVPTTYADIASKMGKDTTTTSVDDGNGGPPRDTTIIINENPADIKQLLLWEEWFFDKKHSRMDVRIVGICPIYLGFDMATSRLVKKRLFWVRYEDVRQTLASNEVFNTFNDAQRVSYEDLLLQRRFDSYIVAESNVYDDRFVNQYKLGQQQIFEAERIKTEIFNFEQDLWEY
jgi:gliding motility associated protien GldN